MFLNDAVKPIDTDRPRSRYVRLKAAKQHPHHCPSIATNLKDYARPAPCRSLAREQLNERSPKLFLHHLFLSPPICSGSRIFQEEFPVRDFPAGYGPASTAAIGAKPPAITTLRYTGPAATDASAGEDDAELLLCGCDDGAVTVRPALAAGVYARVQAHDGDAVVAAAACSCDGEWIISGDSDGMLAVHRLRREPFEVGSGTGGGGIELCF